jgi:hypothetical protein
VAGRDRTGGSSTITRNGVGAYPVSFDGLTIGGGHVRVTAWGNAGMRCKVAGWGTYSTRTRVGVPCFTIAGGATRGGGPGNLIERDPGEVAHVSRLPGDEP